MKALPLILSLVAFSLSTIGEDLEPVWLSSLPEPVNLSSLPVVVPSPVVVATRPIIQPGDLWPLVDPCLCEEVDHWLSFASDPFEGWRA